MNGYIITYDDDQGSCFPMSWNPDCDGAVEATTATVPLAFFASIEEARTAIRISCKHAELRLAQGMIANDDFLPPGKRNLKIKPLLSKQ